MNNNLQVKNKKTLIKGTALAFATVMTVACIPAFPLSQKSAYAETDGGNTIYLLNAGDGTANVGEIYTIKDATFGNDPQQGTKITDITVTYQGNNVEVANGTFEVVNTGEYNICYKYTNDGKIYTLDYTVTATRSSATISFDSNLDSVLPTVYDISYDKAKDGDSFKSVSIPLPKVYNEKEEEVEVSYYTKSELDRTANDYVVVSVKSPEGNNVGLTHQDGKILVPGSVFGASNVEIGKYTITYAYYTKPAGASTAQCIKKNEEKSFSVKRGYYSDYELKANVGTIPTFVTGVETEIASATATVTFKNSLGNSATETANIKYSAKILYKNGETYEEVPNAVVDGKFTPAKDGDYRIIYTVEDFYGNKKESQAQSFSVSDTKKPEVFMYDASDTKNYTDGEPSKGISEYIDASSKLKTKTGKNNVVIYAIGAKDNASSLENIKMTRKIRNSNSSTIDVTEYNAYNLIFNYKYSDLDATDLLGKAISGKNETEADTWLKNNKYLKVINTLDAVKTALGDSTITADQIESKKSALVEAGYAYISATHEITTGSYTIRYIAVDESNNETTSDSYTMKIESSNVVSAGKPKVTTTTKFAESYTTKEVIEFAEPVATDEIDSRMDIVTTYSFLNGQKETIGEVVTLKDEFKVDLSKAPADAKYVSIVAEATNDFGETGRFEKVLAIADINDTLVPKVKSAQTTGLQGEIKQNGEVDLPVVVYEDDYVAVMTAKVQVYLLDEDGNRTGDPITTLPGSTNYSTWGKSKTFTYNAGKVVPPFAGNYEVMIQAQDPANNIISTYYYFTATSTEKDYYKLNVPSTINGDGTATVGDKITLEIPSVTSKLTEKKAIFGLEEDGTAKYYSISVSGPATPRKDTETTYTFDVAGKYTFKYNVNIAIYDTGKLSVDEEGVYYQSSEVKYRPDDDNYDNVGLDESIKKALKDAKVKTLESDEYVLEVSESSSSKTFEINYGSGEPYSSSYQLNEEIVIYSAGATGNVDTEKSIVSIVNPNNSTKEYKLSEFTDTVKYTFTKNGQYTISYKVVDKNGIEYSAKDGVKSFTISVGDAEKPEVAFKEDFLKDEYNLNDELTLDISKIVLTDNGYGAGTDQADIDMRNSLLANMKVTLTRVDDSGNTIEITNLLKDETNAYKYKLDNAGTYTLTVKTTDAVGQDSTSVTKTFEVSTEGKKAGVSTKTVGIILIVLACLVLAGVIAYFVISRIRMNKKGTKLVKKNKKEDKAD